MVAGYLHGGLLAKELEQHRHALPGGNHACDNRL
jgi:hypothetical protein